MASTNRLSFEGQGSLWIGTANVAPGACLTATCTLVTITDANAKVGDVISVSPGAALVAGGCFGSAYCSTAGTITVPFINCTASTVTQPSVALAYKILRPANS